MQGKIQLRLAVLAALAALVAVIVPATLAAGADDPPITGDPSVVLLKLGTQNEVTWTTETQEITTRRNKCTPVTFGSDSELLVVTTDGGDLGYDSAALGVASQGEGNSGKCAQVNADAGEELNISLGDSLDGYAMNAIDLDLELKFNASIHVIYKLDGAEVASDDFDGMGPDDGPDSADGDNYRYNSMDQGVDVLFDEVDFAPVDGSFSVEAGFDGTESGALAANAFSQFQVVPVYDGEITCGDSVDVGSLAELGILGEVTMHALDLDGGGSDYDYNSDCVDLKFYFDGATTDSLAFIPVRPDTNARYTIAVTIDDQPITVSDGSGGVPAGTITSLVAVYNEDGDLTFPTATTKPLQSCQKTPPTTDPAETGYDAFWGQSDPLQLDGVNVFPDGESICFYDASVNPTGVDGSGNPIGTEEWLIVFEDDPGLGFR